jgi:uncharacterized iron-regulated protein
MKIFQFQVFIIFVPMKQNWAILLAGIASLAFSSDKPAYTIYNSSGREVKYSKMIRELGEADIILFGELHDNPISHWLQLEITRDLYDLRKESMVLGAEMFEADNQLLLDEYLQGLITEAKFEDEARLWNNHKTDYKPLLTFAFDRSLPFVATNVPRRYANLVYRKGFEGLDGLSVEARRYIAPLPVPYDPALPGYQKMLKMGNHGGGGMTIENLPRAQAIKDATMGHFILQNWSSGKLFLHFNGAGHSDNYEGIYWYLQQENPDVLIRTISTVLQEDISELAGEFSERADFIIAVPDRMTRTY